MNKELLILRHGKSDWNTSIEDFYRPLIERGKRGAELLGVWTQQQDLVPDFVLSSPATRALDTAKRFCHAMGLSEQLIYQEAQIYEANAATLKAIINECPHQARRVLIVGHNPGLEHLLQDLLSDPISAAEDGKILPTATLAHLTLGQYWSQTSSGCAILNSLIRPSLLAEQFPFVGLKGAEFRPRPAYYYSQAAVIPYCIVDNVFKLLLVSSSHKQRWRFPTSIIPPGSTPQAAGTQAAWELAGVKGVISDEVLGYYSQAKWRGQCVIQLFPLAVTNIVPSAEWSKQHKRQWLTPKQAMLELNSPGLSKTIKKLLTLLEQ